MSVAPEQVPIDCSTAFLLALARCGISPDVAELLIRGDGRGTVAPGALPKAIAAALNAWPGVKPGLRMSTVYEQPYETWETPINPDHIGIDGIILPLGDGQ